MAEEAGIYKYLWCPEEFGIKKAVELISPLETGLALLVSKPAKFKLLNPANGWGSYDGLVKFVAEYLEACKLNPDAYISVA